MIDWISIKNILLTMNQLIIMTDQNEVIPGFYSSNNSWLEVGYLETTLNIKHWMPFPSPLDK